MRFTVKYLRNRLVDLSSRMSVRPRQLKVFEALSVRRNLNEAVEVRRSLKLRMDLRKPKRVVKRSTIYGRAFRAKQTLKLFYGFKREVHFRKVALRATNTAVVNYSGFLFSFELRPLTALLRVGFIRTPEMGKQWISHGYISLNGVPLKNVDIVLSKNDVIAVALAKRTEALANLISLIKEKRFVFTNQLPYEVNFKTFEIYVYSDVATSFKFPFKVHTGSVAALYQ